MPKPCPRCGLENADEAMRCSRCDAPLREPTSLSPGFGRFLLWLAGFVAITALGVGALVYVHQTAVPLGDPVVPPIDTAAQEEAFAREQAQEAPPPAAGAGDAPPAPMPAGVPPGAPAAPPASVPAPGVPAGPDAGPVPDPLDPLLGEEDVTDQLPQVPSTLEWNREILPPTGQPSPPGVASPPATGSHSAPDLPGSNPATSFPPLVPPGAEAGSAESAPGEAPGVMPGVVPQAGSATPSGPGMEPQAPGGPSPAPPQSPEPASSLAASQQTQCASEGFLTRFVCHERVRLNYCENRWNKHPDCMLDGNATTY